MSGDTLVYDMASASEGSAQIFVKKDYISLLDAQNGNYRGNQSVIETSALANSNKYMNYREAYLAVPMVLTATGDAFIAPETPGGSMDYAFGLKNWFGSIIHSITLEIGGTTVVQQTPFCGLWNSFKLMTSLSWLDVATMGASIGFYPDNALSVGFVTAANVNGIGTFNNVNALAFPVVSAAHNSYDVANEGFLRRQQYINYDPEGFTAPTCAAFSTLLTGTACNALYKSYINTKTGGGSGTFQNSIMAIIELKHIHSFFQNVPLLKGCFMKLTLNLNQTTVDLTTGATKELSATVTSPLGGVSPIMVASANTSNGAVSLVNSKSAKISLAVGNTPLASGHTTLVGPFTNSISLVVPAYTFNPVYEQAYLSQPVKRIVYTDIYQYLIQNIAAGSQINQLCTNGIAGIKSTLCVPVFSPVVAGSGVLGLSPLQSPFDTCGGGTTSPLCLLNNFNVVVSGQNMLYNTQRYSYETFLNQLVSANSLNAGLTDGLTSGFINQLSFETAHCYHYVNCSRMLPIEEPVPKSVSIIGQNQSARTIDLYVFIEYGVEIQIDVLTGNRV